METNFFSQIADLDLTGNLKIVIAKGMENNLIVSVMLDNEQCGDTAKHLIPPLKLNTGIQELDSGFFTAITTPLKKVSGLMCDMESFLKQLDTAKAQSAMEKQQQEKEKKEQDGKAKKYTDAMQKVGDLEKEGRYKEAWMKLPNPTEYPEHAQTIRKRQSELSARFSPALFDFETATPKPHLETANEVGEITDEQLPDKVEDEFEPEDYDYGEQEPEID